MAREKQGDHTVAPAPTVDMPVVDIHYGRTYFFPLFMHIIIKTHCTEVQTCTIPSISTLTASAACCGDQPDTPRMRDMDSPTQHLLHGESL